jgi:hypothetical protein
VPWRPWGRVGVSSLWRSSDRPRFATSADPVLTQRLERLKKEPRFIQILYLISLVQLGGFEPPTS